MARAPGQSIQSKTKLFSSFPNYHKQSRQRKERIPPGTCPPFSQCTLPLSAHPSQKSECLAKHTLSGFTTMLTLQMILVFSSPAANCSQSSPACVLKPRIPGKPCNISCNRNAISEACTPAGPLPSKLWAPKEVNHHAKFKGLRLPLHFVISAASTGLLLSAAQKVGPVWCLSKHHRGEAAWSSYFQVNSWEKQGTTNFSRLCALANEALKVNQFA